MLNIRIIKQYIKSNFIFLLLPTIPLIEGLFFDPVFSFKVIGDTTPFLQGLVLLYLLFFKRSSIRNQGAIFLLLLLLNIIVYVKVPEVFSYSIIFVLAFLLMNDRRLPVNYEHLKAFVLSYSFLSLLIYFFRLDEYSFDLIRTRGGANIYGSNELIGILLVLASYSFLFKKQIYFKDSFVFLSIITLFSVLFIRRVSLVGSVILIVLFFLRFSNFLFSRRVFKASLFMLAPAIILYYIIEHFNFVESMTLRFSTAMVNAESFSKFIEETSYARTLLWEDGLSLFKNNIIGGIGAGNFRYYSFQSTAHSLFINNLAEFGIFLGLMLNIIYLIPLLKIILAKSLLTNKILALSSYVLFLLIANISGINLFQNTGYVSGFSTMAFFFIIKFVFSKNVDCKEC